MENDNLPKTNIPKLDDLFTVCSGVLMFESIFKERDLGVSRDQVYEFIEEFRQRFPNFLYYGVRYASGRDKVNLDFCYLVDRGETQQKKMDNFNSFYNKNFKNEVLKKFGSSLIGYDVSFGARGVFINTDLLSLNQNK